MQFPLLLWYIVFYRLSVGLSIEIDSPLVAPLPIEPVFRAHARDDASPRTILAAISCDLHRNLGWVHHYLADLHGTLSRLWLLPFNDYIAVEDDIVLPLLDLDELKHEKLWFVIRETWRRTRARVQHGLRDNSPSLVSDGLLSAAGTTGEHDLDATLHHHGVDISSHESPPQHSPQLQRVIEPDSPISPVLLSTSPSLTSTLDLHVVSHVKRP